MNKHSAVIKMPEHVLHAWEKWGENKGSCPHSSFPWREGTGRALEWSAFKERENTLLVLTDTNRGSVARREGCNLYSNKYLPETVRLANLFVKMSFWSPPWWQMNSEWASPPVFNHTSSSCLKRRDSNNVIAMLRSSDIVQKALEKKPQITGAGSTPYAP